MQNDATASRSSIRRHLFAGVAVVALLAGGVGGWASTTEFAGAVIASGSVVVDSNIKKVQHLTGGIVALHAAYKTHEKPLSSTAFDDLSAARPARRRAILGPPSRRRRR